MKSPRGQTRRAAIRWGTILDLLGPSTLILSLVYRTSPTSTTTASPYHGVHHHHGVHHVLSYPATNCHWSYCISRIESILPSDFHLQCTPGRSDQPITTATSLISRFCRLLLVFFIFILVLDRRVSATILPDRNVPRRVFTCVSLTALRGVDPEPPAQVLPG